MANDPELKIKISAQLAEVKSALEDLQKSLKRSGSAGKTAGREASGGLASIEQSAKNAAKQLAAMVSVYAGIRAGKAIIQAADDFQRYEARLKLVTNSEEEYARAREATYRIAQSTGQELTSTIDLYTRLAGATRSLGVSQDALVSVTDTVNKTIALSGASATEAGNAMTQFGQMLAMPKARAQELMSIISQTPELARAIERGLGIQQGKLKEYAETVGLTGREVVAALLNVSDTVDAEFRQLPTTVGQAATKIRNDLMRMAGSTELDGLVESLENLRETLNDPAFIKGAEAIARAFVGAFGIAADYVSMVTQGVMGWKLMIFGTGDDLMKLDNKILTINRDMESMRQERERLAGQAGRELEVQQIDAELKRMSERRQEMIQEYEDLAVKRTQAAAAGKKDNEAEAERLKTAGAAAAAEAEIEKNRARAAEDARRAAEQRQKQIQGLLDSLRDEAMTHGMTAAQLTQYRLAQMGASEADKARAAQLSVTIAKQKESVEWAKRQTEIARELASLEVEMMRMAGDEVGARRAELSERFKQMLADIENAPDMDAAAKSAGKALIQKFIDTDLARARLDELRAQLDAAVSGFDRAQQMAANQVQTGQLSPGAAQTEVRAAAETAITGMQALRSELQALADQDVPGARDALLELDTTMIQIGRSSATGLQKALMDLSGELQAMNANFAGDTIKTARDGLSTLFQGLADDSKKGKEVVRDFVRSFAMSMMKIAADALATMVVLRALQAFGFGVGGGAGGAGSLITGLVKHSGGLLRGGTRRQVPAATFLGAARYHSGGLVGLGPNEVPAILKKNEEVITQSDPRHIANGGGTGGMQAVRINLLDDRSNIGDYMESSAGESVIMEVLERNSMRLRTLLG